MRFLAIEAVGAAEAAEAVAEAAAEATAHAAPATLPLPWRFETPFTEQAHPGYCCAGGRFLRLVEPAHEEAGPAAGSSAPIVEPIRRLGADGEVAPESTAARVWPGAHLLATYLHEPDGLAVLGLGAPSSRLSSDPHRAGGRRLRVLELGAGSGVPGLAAWTLMGEACDVLMLTDLDENLPRLRETAAINGATSARVRIAGLDWMKPLPAEVGKAGPWDVVLAADCVFWEGLFEPLVTTLTRLAQLGVRHREGAEEACGDEEARAAPAPSSPVVLLTVTSRLDRAEKFEAFARAGGWAVEEVCLRDVASLQAMMASTHTRLLRLRQTPQVDLH